LAAPQGNFVMPDPAPASVLFITGGSGITPVMSMLRTLARRDQVTDIVHLHSAPTESDVMFAAELAELERAHDGYRLRLRSTRPEGRLDLARLDDELPDWRERQTWACGPEGMLNAAERVWHAEGSAERLHLERFAVSKAAVHGRGGTVESHALGRRSLWLPRLVDGCWRTGRRSDAVRLPNGYLSVVCGGSARGART
jgi:ferredoxin-NADP reductase